MEAGQTTSGPPYASKAAGLGGVPTVGLDVPITSVFLALFVGGAVMHMTIFQLNNRRQPKHKFIPSGAMFGFCMARITTCVMRLVWATRPNDIAVAIAANIFVNAGVIILIILNLLFTLRVFRAMHPEIGWSRPMHFAFIAYFVSIPCLLVALITAIVQLSYTINPTILAHDRTITLVGGTYNAVAAFAPIPILLAALLLRYISIKKSTRSTNFFEPVQPFGSGSFSTKFLILFTASILIALGACFRTGIAYVPRPVTDPAWYHSKACFYVFNFTLEILVVYGYAAMRIDRRFHVPDGSSKVRCYVDGPPNLDGSRAAFDKHGEKIVAGGSVHSAQTETRIETDEQMRRDFAPRGTLEKDAGAQV